MNDLLERYLSAVCSYFVGPKRKTIYKELKEQILSSVKHYDDLEELLISYGHPRSLALSYGYRPITRHIYNPKIVSFVERVVFTLSFIYLFFSTLYYLQQFNCLPFQSTQHVASTINTSTFFTWVLSHPIIIMGLIFLVSILTLVILDYKNSLEQEYDLKWNMKTVNQLPPPSHYPCHIVENILIIIFTIFFFFFALYFTSNKILEIQHASSQMIHLMTYFFQPFVMIIYLDYIIDMTKKRYSKKYLKYSSGINLFTIIALIIFIVNSNYLQHYLLPLNITFEYILVDFFIIGAICMILFISLYKLFRNIKSYRNLFRK